MATVRDSKAFHRELARLPGVKVAVHAAAEPIADRARSNLAGHRETGASSIEIHQLAVDTEIVLNDVASLSIEFGRNGLIGPLREGQRRPGPMEGLHVLSRAVYGG